MYLHINKEVFTWFANNKYNEKLEFAENLQKKLSKLHAEKVKFREGNKG